MTALTQDRATPERDARLVADPLAAGVTIFAGGMYMLDAAGAARPAAAQAGATTMRVRALAQRKSVAGYDDVTDGALGCFRLANGTGADEVTRADIGALCYALDDATVARGSDGGKRPEAGRVLDVDARGVWVRVG